VIFSFLEGVPLWPKNPMIPSTEVPSTKIGILRELKLAENFSHPVVMIIIVTGIGNGVPGMIGTKDISPNVEII